MIYSDKMSEAEVSILLAHYLIQNRMVQSDVTVSIDGAHVKIGEVIHFEIFEYLKYKGFQVEKLTSDWRGIYSLDGFEYRMILHSTPGTGDVSAVLSDGKRLIVESKKGSLLASKSSQEYPLLREAIGQLMTIEKLEGDEVLAVAAPFSEKTQKLVLRWGIAPLIRSVGLRFLLIKRDGEIFGVDGLLRRD